MSKINELVYYSANNLDISCKLHHLFSKKLKTGKIDKIICREIENNIKASFTLAKTIKELVDNLKPKEANYETTRDQK